ncbi:MAG TPA: CapA family protein [Devosiaceae bacterium]|jgi:poly-gamma-glutamate synthesis protein (capsule biosynthesis protein)
MTSANDGTKALLIVGDTNIQERADPNSAFAKVKDLLASAQIIFAHLEGPLAEPSRDPLAPDIPHKPGWKHSGKAMAGALKAAGYDGVSCASNVSFPAPAAVRSVEVLDEIGLKHCGVGRTLAAAREPVIIEKAGLKLGFLSYTSVFWPTDHAASATEPGCATIKAYSAYQPGPRALEMPGAEPITRTFADQVELEAMREDVRKLRPKVDLVILSCHWGVSGRGEPVEYQREIAHAALDTGADMVFGHHPHVVQGSEVYKGKPIFYSVGNFVFDWDIMRGKHLDGIALKVAIDGKKITAIEVVPVRRDADNDIAVLARDSAGGREILGDFEKASRKLHAGFTLDGGTTLRLGQGASRVAAE